MNLSKKIFCGHCGNTSKMVVVGEVNDELDQPDFDPECGPMPPVYDCYSVLRCYACQGINIISYIWHEGRGYDDDIGYNFLFPSNPKYPIGLPENILKAYKSAEKVKSIDVNAYAILMRRLLELVCLDRGASPQNNLYHMLKELANKNEIPTKLVDVVSGLREFGNISAYANMGELTEEEIPMVNALCDAILEYVYSAPYLATIVENKLKSIKHKTKGN